MKAAPMGKNVKCSNSVEGLQLSQHHRPMGPREKKLTTASIENATTKISK